MPPLKNQRQVVFDEIERCFVTKTGSMSTLRNSWMATFNSACIAGETTNQSTSSYWWARIRCLKHNCGSIHWSIPLQEDWRLTSVFFHCRRKRPKSFWSGCWRKWAAVGRNLFRVNQKSAFNSTIHAIRRRPRTKKASQLIASGIQPKGERRKAYI